MFGQRQGLVIATAAGLFLVVFVGLDRLAGVRLSMLPALGLYALIYLLLSRVLRLDLQRGEAARAGGGVAVEAQRQRLPGDEALDPSQWPTSGPIGRFGQRGLMIVFMLSGLLCLLVPWQAWQILRQGWGNWRLSRRRAAPGPLQGNYRPPFVGEWLLYNGGSTPQTSHSWEVLQQRYACDFVVADAQFRRHQGRGTRTGDYYAYGQPILAAADGEVVAVERRCRDAPWLGYGIIDAFSRSLLGNHVLIRHAPGEYGVYAHLAPESVCVEPGQRVRSGQRIGLCGHSGHSAEPHLHFHLQDGPDPYVALGLPLRLGGRSPELGDRVLGEAEVG